jgi:hypothetical protein
VCKHPLRNLLKNNSKAKITKKIILTIVYTSDTHSKSHLVTSHSLSEIFQGDCGVGITGFYKNQSFQALAFYHSNHLVNASA